MNTKACAALLFLLLIPVFVRAGQEEDVVAIKTADGFLLVWNTPGIHFTLPVRGKDVRAVNSSEHVFFNVDGVMFQVQTVAISNFMKAGAADRPDAKAILLAHRDWESDFIQTNLLGTKVNVQTSPQKLKNGSAALLWKFDSPKVVQGEESKVKQQMYLTTVMGEHVILLNAGVEGTATEGAVQQLLIDALESLKVSSTTIDVKELQESIRKRDRK